MKTAKALVLSGVARWAKVFEENRDMKGYEGAYVDCDGAYTIDLLLDNENYEKLKESGSAKEGRVTDEGISVKFERKHVVEVGGEIKPEWGGPPRVVDNDKQPWDTDIMGFIGNGSKVEIGLVVYPSKKRPGTRLESVKVVELEEYKGNPADELPF